MRHFIENKPQRFTEHMYTCVYMHTKTVKCIHERICIVCGPDANEVEDELHFLLKCSKYNDLRQCLFIKAYNKNNDFNTSKL